MRDTTEFGILTARSPTFRWAPGMLAVDEDGVSDRVVRVTQVPGLGEVIRCEHSSHMLCSIIPDLSDPVTSAAIMGLGVCDHWAAGEEGRVP